MLHTFLTHHQDRIIALLCARIQQATSTLTSFAPHTLRDNVAKAAAAFLDALDAEDFSPLDRFIDAIIAPRTVEDFPLTVLHQAFTVFRELLPPLLQECYGQDAPRILQDLQRLHLLIDAVLQRLVQAYETRSKTLVRTQQEQLQAYSRHLEMQLVQVGEDFETLRDFNDNILQSMTSGLLVVNKDTHHILKMNRAMERLSGLRESAVVGKTVEEVFTGLPDLAIDALADEVEQSGKIAARQYRAPQANGRVRYRTIRGQTFYNQHGESKGVIVLVDDISDAEILRETFSRYLSRHVMEQILANPDSHTLSSTRRNVTVLFADIRNFTSFAERHSPEAVVDILNQYFNVMVHALFESQGTLDKFLGDGLLALFGTPVHQEDHAQRAVQAALNIQRAITALNDTRRAHDQPTLQLGIGINSGDAIVGTIGSEERMEYTVIGDMVNVAQRLQAQAKGGEIIIGAQTLRAVRHLIAIHDTVDTYVKGRRQPVRAHRIGPA